MDDIADLRCIALRLVRDIRTGTGQLGIFSNRLLRLLAGHGPPARGGRSADAGRSG